MKRKRPNIHRQPWTPFVACEIPSDAIYSSGARAPDSIFRNSRYQVSIWIEQAPEPFGVYAHLSIKDHDKSARHDWRDLQRIKNELMGAECDAVEVYPAESKLVDSANQYHLFVFRDYRLPFGFQSRLVSDGDWRQSKQRPFEPGARPADCLDARQFDEHYQRLTRDAATTSDDAAEGS
jgi:hypothetical protein